MFLTIAVAGARAHAADGAWSDFGPRMTHNQPSTAGGNPPIVVARGNLYVSDRTGINRLSIAAPNGGWTYLANGATSNRAGRMAVNALGNPLLAEKGRVVRLWNGSAFTEASFSPPANGGWYTLASLAVDPTNGDVFAAGNFTIYKSVNGGSSFSAISDVGKVCRGSNNDGKGWIYALAVTPWRELLTGGETDALYSSLDGGTTWSALPKFPKVGNRYAVSPTKDGELLISTAFSDAGNDYFMRYTADGTLVPATEGLATFLINDQQHVASQVVYLDSGENFVVARYRTDNSVHCLKWDGASWTSIESLPNGPGAELLSNSFGTDGSRLYVGTASGQIKVWTPSARLPFKVSAGSNVPAPAGRPATLTGTVSPAGAYTYRWSARGSKAVAFTNPSAASTAVTFAQPGDYAVNLKATDSKGVTAGATLLVHVTRAK